MKCENFCNAHCSYDCPNAAIEEFEDYYDLPAEEAGLSRVKCKDCIYSDKRCDCDDCYFQNTPDCPRTEAANENNT